MIGKEGKRGRSTDSSAERPSRDRSTVRKSYGSPYSSSVLAFCNGLLALGWTHDDQARLLDLFVIVATREDLAEEVLDALHTRDLCAVVAGRRTMNGRKFLWSRKKTKDLCRCRRHASSSKADVFFK